MPLEPSSQGTFAQIGEKHPLLGAEVLPVAGHGPRLRPYISPWTWWPGAQSRTQTAPLHPVAPLPAQCKAFGLHPGMREGDDC